MRSPSPTIGHNGPVNEHRWFNPSQPQTLQTGVLLCYLSAVFGLIFGVPASGGSPILALFIIIGLAAGGFGIANEKRWGYLLAVAGRRPQRAAVRRPLRLGDHQQREPAGLVRLRRGARAPARPSDEPRLPTHLVQVASHAPPGGSMHFNLADLWERVADTVPDHEALVCGRAPLHVRADRRAGDPARARARRRAASAPATTSRCTSTTASSTSKAMLAAFKLGAVPINVNYRYVEEELRYLLDDADARAVVFHREFAPKLAAIARGPARRSARSSSSTTARTPTRQSTRARRRRVRGRARGRAHRARLRRPVRRRALHPLHRRHHRHAEGRDVAPRGRVLRRDGWRRAAVRAPITTPEEIAERCRRAPHAVRPRVSVHARHRALDGVQRAVHAAARVIIPTQRHLDAARALAADRAPSRRTSSSSSATRSRGRSSRCSTRRRPRRSTCRPCGCCSRAARSSRPP